MANRDYAIVHSLRGTVPDAAIQALELILGHVYDLNDRVNQLPAVDTKPPTIEQIEKAIQSRKRLNVTQFLGVLAQPQNAAVPEVTALPDVNDPLSQDGGLVRFNGVLYVFDGVPEPGSWVPVVSAGMLQDTRANRSTYDAANYDNFIYHETDTALYYNSDGSDWLYGWGRYKLAQSGIAAFVATLTTDDTGLLIEVTDYDHIHEWTGAALVWGPGELGSGYSLFFESAPTTDAANAWQIYDGSTVARLNKDGTTTNVTLDNLGTAAYLKGGTSSAAVAAASGTVANTTATNQATVVTAHAVVDTLAAGVGNAAFATPGDAAHASHNHTQDAHNHGPGTLELRNKQLRLYFRR